MNSFYSFSCIQNQARSIRVDGDGQDGNVYDATGSGKVNVFSKTGTAKRRFLGVGNELFFTDGVDLEAWLTPTSIWQASTSIQPGTLINAGTSPYNLQMALGGITLNIVATSSDGTHIFIYFDPGTIPEQFANLQGTQVKFLGLYARDFAQRKHLCGHDHLFDPRNHACHAGTRRIRRSDRTPVPARRVQASPPVRFPVFRRLSLRLPPMAASNGNATVPPYSHGDCRRQSRRRCSRRPMARDGGSRKRRSRNGTHCSIPTGISKFTKDREPPQAALIPLGSSIDDNGLRARSTAQ